MITRFVTNSVVANSICHAANVSDHECFDYDMSDVLRHDMCLTFKREIESKQNNKWSYFPNL